MKQIRGETGPIEKLCATNICGVSLWPFSHFFSHHLSIDLIPANYFGIITDRLFHKALFIIPNQLKTISFLKKQEIIKNKITADF